MTLIQVWVWAKTCESRVIASLLSVLIITLTFALVSIHFNVMFTINNRIKLWIFYASIIVDVCWDGQTVFVVVWRVQCPMVLLGAMIVLPQSAVTLAGLSADTLKLTIHRPRGVRSKMVQFEFGWKSETAAVSRLQSVSCIGGVRAVELSDQGSCGAASVFDYSHLLAVPALSLKY